MASKGNSVWALDIGNNALKAIRLSTDGETLEVIGSDYIRHGKILTGTGVKDVERDELIYISLRRFIEHNDIGNDDIVIAVPSQNSFARFVNLPPVESKRIPEIVKFEASQQIPFDINDVQWDWQMMSEPGEPEAKVGIFAIKNEVVDAALEYFKSEGLKVKYVQMAPMALYNYTRYDNDDWGESEKNAVVVLDIGAENTDLVVCTKSEVWQRCIHIGGNAFTRAIADSFKLTFQRAEKLKRTAAMSKYARQTYQAMRPIFSELASEVQRSLNFFSNSNPDVNIVKVVALGGGTRMRGLLKYLRQTLQVPVEKPESFNRLAMGPGVSAVKFHQIVPDLGVVYGLGLQALGHARIKSNLLPRKVARSIAWAAKARYFTVAACIVLFVSVMSFARTYFDWAGYNHGGRAQLRAETGRIIEEAQQALQKVSEQKARASGYEESIHKAFKPFEHREVVPRLYETIISGLPNERNISEPEQQELYRAFAARDVGAIKRMDRKERKQVFVTGLSMHFVEQLETAELGRSDFVRRSGGSDDLDDEEGIDERYLMELEMASAASMYQKKTYADTGPAKKKGESGFVVTIEGYSPYKDVGSLLDPVAVGSDQSKWGVVTRLLHLKDVNSPFELYKKTDPKHFKLRIGEVALDADMPGGIGIVENRQNPVTATKSLYNQKTSSVIIDPMTKEVISKEAKLDDDGKPIYSASNEIEYEVNDHWFVIQCKFLWKDAPKTSKAIGGFMSGS
jgi:type IV pilus assembly protein PilM